MAVPPLVFAVELAGFPGAPFTDSAAFSAGERIRDYCGWHVAPAVTETLTVDGPGGRWLFLPTRRLTSVTAVRDVTVPAAPVTITDYRWTAKGTLERTGSVAWPSGLRSVAVDVVHGYVSCPGGLLEWAAELARRTGRGGDVRSETVGGVSFSYGTTTDTLTGVPVSAVKYRVSQI